MASGTCPQKTRRVRAYNDIIYWGGNYCAKAHINGAAAVMESPKECYLWDMHEAWKLFCDVDIRTDSDYAARSWSGARHKMQRLRHNVIELQKVEEGQCHHIHAEDKWSPTWNESKQCWFYPSREGAEYTADLTWVIAMALSM